MAWSLIADIGGTNMRLASAIDGKISASRTFPTVGKSSVRESVISFIEDQGSYPDQVAIAAAGIVNDGSVTLTNTGTRISESELKEICHTDNATILNDFEAAAWSLADVSQDDILTLQGDDALVKKARLIIGPGTGLGVGALVWQNGQPVVVEGEGGHVRLSPDTADELEIFKELGLIWPETSMGDGYAVEAEAVLSGTGLPFFYAAIAATSNSKLTPRKASEIFALAKAKSDMIAVKTIHLFVKYLGELAGDMGTTFAARGGVFLAGGVIAANPWIFDDPAFLTAFNSGGRHSDFRKQLPVYLYQNSQFGLIGALNYLLYSK